jgi:hypothetical protein
MICKCTGRFALGVTRYALGVVRYALDIFRQAGFKLYALRFML